MENQKGKKKDLQVLDINELAKRVSELGKAAPIPAEEFEAYIKTHKFDPAVVPAENSSIMFLHGKVIGSRQNVITITGKAKSRKTVLASAVATSFFHTDKNFLGFSSSLALEDKVLHIDSEQGYEDYYQSVSRIFQDAGLNHLPDQFLSVHTRDAEIEYRLALTAYLIEKIKPSVIILDGGTDFVYDINSQTESVHFGQTLLKWSYKYDCLIIVIIHTTKTTGFMTGSLGTYLEKKSQTVIKVEQDEKAPNFSHVSCQYSRRAPFPKFTIEYDEEKKQYVIVDDQRVTTKGVGGDKDPAGYPDDIHRDIIHRLFLFKDNGLNTIDLRNAIHKAIPQVTRDTVQARELHKWVKYYESKAWIFMSPDSLWVPIKNAFPKPQTNMFDPAEIIDNDPITSSDDLPF